ncbi:lytic transglycosylase domain-containing protein [Lacihabitans soyangensis]|uniref:LysM peptidoglycan-binding domain-containing protein n=1 Tax=Lacihabitans soyangensis TaxID=869394 RepID=A0AAE3KSH6_9BACT|nr:lytic transglycosylase domain-containing protein [Lacihabitans soyangensis]MCP9762594.1 LysM peptidoglycan-binding domain-containing protein [Lacihabitans soyangensis]
MKISKILLTFSFIAGLQTIAHSQVNTVILEEQEIADTTVMEEPKIIYPYELIVFDERDKKEYKVLIEDPKIVEQRLKAIEKTMPMVYNESVKKYLDFFLIRRPSFSKHMMEEKDIYFPVFENALRQSGMPEELKYLALLESGLNPKAVSRSKAVGLWQFMSFTGKEMGLTINEYIDERMHIEKSTEAACKYLKQLYKRFDDWDLALASYNTGPGRIGRTMRSTGLTNYWDLHPHIHPDTRAYVPQFIALAYMMNYGHLHGITPENKKHIMLSEKITVDKYVDLSVLASLAQMDLQDIKKLNPHIKGNILPAMPYGYELKLPANNIAYFNANREAILDSSSKRGELPAINNEPSNNPTMLASSGGVSTTEDGTIVIGRKTSHPVTTDVTEEDEQEEIPVKYKSITKQVKKVHKVKRGEFLNKIAMKYDVNMKDIKKWNNKRSSQVNAGERLVIYVDVKQKVKANSIAAKSSSETIKKSATYTVRPGDTLWNISQRYDGVTISDIKKWNNISGNTVKVGQKIKIKS